MIYANSLLKLFDQRVVTPESLIFANTSGNIMKMICDDLGISFIHGNMISGGLAKNSEIKVSWLRRTIVVVPHGS